MKKLNIALTALILLIPFGQLTRLPIPIEEIHVYLHDIAVGFCALYAVYALISGKTKLNSPFFLPIGLFIAAMIFSLIFNAPYFTLGELGIASLYAIRWIALTGVLVVTRVICTKKPAYGAFIINLLIMAGSVMAILGLIQYVMYPNLRNLMYLGWDPHQYRLFGTFLDSGFMGIMLVLTIILLINKELTKMTVTLLIIVFTALMLTYSRSSYVALTAGFVAFAVMKKNFRALIVLPIMIVSMLILPRPAGEGVRLERTSTISARITDYDKAIAIIRKNTVVGVGFNAYRFASEKMGFTTASPYFDNSASGADSSLLFVWATTGIVGLAAFGYMIVAVMKRFRNHTIIIPTMMAILAHSIFLNSLFYPWVLLWLWLILGVGDNTGNRRFIPRLIFRDNLK